MSNYTYFAFHPANDELQRVVMLDDFYGTHLYGCRFADGLTIPMSEAQVIDDRIHWVGDRPLSVSARYQLVNEIAGLHMNGLAKAEDLVSHVVLLTEDVEGPSVTIHGKKNDKRYYCKYERCTEWKSVSAGDQPTARGQGDHGT
jgi:hypothetical protein